MNHRHQFLPPIIGTTLLAPPFATTASEDASRWQHGMHTFSVRVVPHSLFSISTFISTFYSHPRGEPPSSSPSRPQPKVSPGVHRRDPSRLGNTQETASRAPFARYCPSAHRLFASGVPYNLHSVSWSPRRSSIQQGGIFAGRNLDRMTSYFSAPTTGMAVRRATNVVSRASTTNRTQSTVAVLHDEQRGRRRRAPLGDRREELHDTDHRVVGGEPAVRGRG
jgi:hypothetical protein